MFTSKYLHYNVFSFMVGTIEIMAPCFSPTDEQTHHKDLCYTDGPRGGNSFQDLRLQLCFALVRDDR